MKSISIIIVFALINFSASAQKWPVQQRTSNDLLPLTEQELRNDTLTLMSGKFYEINLPELFDQNSGKLQKKLYVQNLSMADYLDLKIEHEINIIDLHDTTYVAKVSFNQVDEDIDPESIYFARIIIRDSEGDVEKRLTILPETIVKKP